MVVLITRDRGKRLELKAKVLTYYGRGKLSCLVCGFDDMRALTIDHIEGGGREHRRKEKIGNMYQWLVEQSYPTGYQTLCMNCNFIKSYRDDIPYLKGINSKRLSTRIRTWVANHTTTFNYESLRIGLGLTSEEARGLRSYLCIMKKQGEVTSPFQGLFKRVVKPVSVFKFLRESKVS